METQFSSSNKMLVSGSLQSILRVRRFKKTTTPFYRSTIEMPSGKNVKRIVEPTNVIFRNSYAFAKSWQRFPKSNWIVLLGRTEPRYESALSILGGRLAQRGKKLDVKHNSLDGVEELWFEENGQDG